MTKKHFIDLADHVRCLNAQRVRANLPLMFDLPAINALADYCQAQNPRFNRERWLTYISKND